MDRHDETRTGVINDIYDYTKTRAPRGTDRSPEYNEHFCYKLY